MTNDGTCQSHPLFLSTRKLPRQPVEILLDIHCCRRLLDLVIDGRVLLVLHLHADTHIVVHRQIAVQRVILKYDGNIPLHWRTVVDHLAVQQQLAGGDLLQARQHAQNGGFSTAGWSHKDDKLAVIHIQIEIMDGMKPIGIHLVYILKLYFSHLYASIIYWFGCASCFCSRRRLELLRRLLPPAANNKAAPARLATRMICSRS